MKISEWLINNTDSHVIQDHEKLAESFEKETGHKANWPHFTEKQTRAAIEARGLGGELKGGCDKLCYGYNVAESLAWEHAQFRSSKNGRGFRFRECIAALQEKGL